MLYLLFLLFAGTGIAEPPQGVLIEATSLKRSEFPDGFPLRLLEVGFAVLRVRVENQSSGAVDLGLTNLTVVGPKGKKLKLVQPTDITPKIVYLYRRGPAGIAGEIYSGSRPWARNSGILTPSQTTVSNAPAPKTLSVNVGQKIRSVLEDYQLRDGSVESGGSQTGYLYIKSKNSGRKLLGGGIRFPHWGAVTIEE